MWEYLATKSYILTFLGCKTDIFLFLLRSISFNYLNWFFDKAITVIMALNRTLSLHLFTFFSVLSFPIFRWIDSTLLRGWEGIEGIRGWILRVCMKEGGSLQISSPHWDDVQIDFSLICVWESLPNICFLIYDFPLRA